MEYADRVEHDELRSVIDQEIDRLAESQRLPVVLCCLEGISHEEAAQRLRWPLGTVKSRLARGRKRLQERLVRKGFAPSAALAAAAGTGLLGGRSIGRRAAGLDRCHRKGRRGGRGRRLVRRGGPGVAFGPGPRGVELDDRHQAEAGRRHPAGRRGVGRVRWDSSWPGPRIKSRRRPRGRRRGRTGDQPKGKAEPAARRRSSRLRARWSTKRASPSPGRG